MSSLYECGCEDCKAERINLASGDKAPIFNDVLKAAENAFKHLVKVGKYSPEDIKQEPYQKLIRETSKVLSSAILDNEIPEQMKKALEADAFLFGGLKTHAQITEAFSLIKDGKVKSYAEVEHEFKKINDTYNLNYLEAEYQFAKSSAQMAANWSKIDENGRYYLQYRTAQDDRVRAEHQELAEITLPKESEFWLSYYPPNGWRCRCTVVEVRKRRYEPSDEEEAMKKGEAATTQIGKDGKNRLEIFRFNPGAEEKLFPPEHPYGKVKGADEVKENSQRKLDFDFYKNSADYSGVAFNEKTGGLKATHKLHHFDKKTGKDEKHVQNILYKSGHKIILEDETTGTGKKVDGILNNQTCDISSISGIGKNTTVRALLHAKSKKAEIAILYYPDRETFEANNLNRSVARFNGQTNYRFKKIIVIVGDEII